MPLTYKLLVWVHVVSMVGALGVLLAARCSREGSAAHVRLATWMLAVGATAGLLVFGVLAHLGGLHPGLAHTVTTKFVLLLVAGAGLGISAKATRTGNLKKASTSRTGAIVALALASLLGIML